MSILIRVQGFNKHLEQTLFSAQHHVESGTQSVFTEQDVVVCRCVLLNDPFNVQWSFSQLKQNYIEFSELSEFDKSLKHELGLIQRTHL